MSNIHLLALMVFAFPSFVVAHDGGLDSYGCHRNGKQGEYHCHRGTFQGKSWSSRATGRTEMDTMRAVVKTHADLLDPHKKEREKTLGEDEARKKTKEDSPTKYKRKNWKHWIDEDKDCQNTRDEVLIAESLVPVTFVTEKKCRVKSGKWKCPYTGKSFTNPKKLDVDHMVPLGNAHNSGGWKWDKAIRRFYANDLGHPEHLIAVEAGANRSKGAQGPDQWKPSDESYWCQYAKDWMAIKYRWGLSVTKTEAQAVKDMEKSCE
ncbi:MAG: YHYH domain-containing protein [bacterium]